jgi:tetratricopeptide (TPR) repeat protein
VAIDQLSLAGRLMNACISYMTYLVKMLWPSSLTVFYPHPRSHVLAWVAAAAFLALVGITVLTLRLRHRAPYLLFGWLWYLGTLVPVIGLVQVGKQSMADRYTYVPLLGIFIAAAWGLAELVKGNPALRRAAAAAAAGVLAALLAVTRVQAGHWTDNEALFTHALAVTPENDLAQVQVGNIRLLQGRLDEAVAHLEEAVRINPRVAESRNSLALALLRRGRTSEAFEHLREAQRIDPGNAQARSNLALTLIKTGMDLVGRKSFTEAVPLFEEASVLIGALPPEGLMQWGMALLQLNRYAEAADRFQSLLALDPESGEAHFELGYALSQLQRPAEAIPHYRKAYGKPGIRSASILWIGDIYRKGELCDEAVQIYNIIPPGDPAYPDAAAGIAACIGKPVAMNPSKPPLPAAAPSHASVRPGDAIPR